MLAMMLKKFSQRKAKKNKRFYCLCIDEILKTNWADSANKDEGGPVNVEEVAPFQFVKYNEQLDTYYKGSMTIPLYLLSKFEESVWRNNNMFISVTTPSPATILSVLFCLKQVHQFCTTSTFDMAEVTKDAIKHFIYETKNGNTFFSKPSHKAGKFPEHYMQPPSLSSCWIAEWLWWTLQNSEQPLWNDLF